MRTAAKFLIIVGAIGATVFVSYNMRFVRADGARKSHFIRTYDPSLGLERFGGVRQSSGGAESAAGRHGVWNSRDIRISIAVNEMRVPALVEAVQRHVRDTLVGAGSRFAGGGYSAPNAHLEEASYRIRYEEANTTGVIRVGPPYRDGSPSAAKSTFIVPIFIEEQWTPN